MDESTVLGQLIGIFTVIGLPVLRLGYSMLKNRLKTTAGEGVEKSKEESRQTKELRAINEAISPDPVTAGWIQEGSKRTDDLVRRFDRFEDSVIRNFSSQFKEMRDWWLAEKEEMINLMRTRQDGMINQVAHMKRGYTEDIEQLRKAVAQLRIKVEEVEDEVNRLKKAS